MDECLLALIFGVTQPRINQIVDKWAPQLSFIGRCGSILDLDTTFDYVTVEEAFEWNLPHYSTAGDDVDCYKSYMDAATPVELQNAGLDSVGCLVDGKDIVTDTLCVDSAKSNAMYGNKMHASGATVVSYICCNGLNFENTNLFLARCSEERIVELWGMQDPNNLKIASLQADIPAELH